MLSTLCSPVKVLALENITPQDFAQAAYYLAGEGLRVAVVVDSRAFPERDALVAGLSERFEARVFNRVRPDPLASDIDAMGSEMAGKAPDLVIGIGGGSVLDSAKALAMLAANGGSLSEYLGSAPKRKIERKGPPLLLVPTTAGTGSEATKVGVYTSDSGRKYTLGSPLLHADAALLVGALAAGMPPALTASTGFDALSHALESLWNRNATPLSVDAAVAAGIAVMRHLEPAYDAAFGGADPASASEALEMMKAAFMAGVAFNRTGTAMVHALSFVLSEEWHVPHGAACAFTLEDAYRYALAEPANRARLARIAAAVFPGADAGDKELSERLLDRVLELKKKMELASRFSDLGVHFEPGSAKTLFARAFEDPKMANNFPAARRDAVFAMLEAKA